jgi:EmrB/QacA subfamily drug resistance transporter
MATPAVERGTIPDTPVDEPLRLRAHGGVAAPPRPAPAPPRPAPAPAAAPPAPAATPQQAGWGLSLVVLVTGMFMSVLDISIVNVAIPTMQNDFGVTTDEIQWVATAYSLALGVVVPVSAYCADRFGPTRVYNISLLGFAAGSALCGLAWNLNSMIVFRVFQAIPGGVLPVVTLTILYRIVPKDRIGAAMGMYGLGIIVAPAVGPTLGGYLVEYVDWRLIFFINVPVGILGTIAAIMVLKKFPGVDNGRFDVVGFLCIATGLFTLLLALTEGQDWGWTSYKVMILITTGVLSLALFVIVELEVERPLLDVRVFRYWPFTNSLLLISVLSVGLFSVLFYIPLFLQQAQGLGAFEAGLLLLPQALVMAVCMPIAGRVYDRFGPRWPAVIGLSINAWGTYELHALTLDTTHAHLVWLLCLRAFGMGIGMMPIMTGGIAAVPPSQVSRASAFNNVVQRTSAALGLAILTAVVTRTQAQMGDDRAGLMATGTAIPPMGSGRTGEMMGMYAVYQQTQLQVFVEAMDVLFIITAIITGVGVVLAFFLRSGPVKKAPGEAAHAVEVG